MDAPDAHGDTALILSVRGQWVESAALLMRRGADPAMRNQAGHSARDLAAATDNPAMKAALGLTAPEPSAGPTPR